MRVSKGYNEYKDFLTNYILPLLGITSDNIEYHKIANKNYLIEQKDGYIYFSTYKDSLFRLAYDRDISDDNLNLVKNIIQAFIKVSKYRIDNSNSFNVEYYSDVHKSNNYKLALQKGICNWIIGQENDCVEKLLDLLELWSVQTYEGKKVTLGFVINPETVSNFKDDYGEWLDFLNEDFSAVFTDCIHSVIELDKNCDFVRYLSISESDVVDRHQFSNILPYRFSNVIEKYVKGKSIGIFLLTNGDIILSKNGEIRFVKRNLRWLNFSYDAFKNAGQVYFNKQNMTDEIIKSIYASMLDVSFSHTGGIIAVVNRVGDLLKEDKETPILNLCDNLKNDYSNQQIFERFKSKNKEYQESKRTHLIIKEPEIRKRILKRKVIKGLVNNKNFTEIDRKLRGELISLDGACIIDTKGEVLSFGAIIKNDSGSSAGGRGAAARKLSRYGMAIKISTDGYIELYVNDSKKYSIK